MTQRAVIAESNGRYSIGIDGTVVNEHTGRHLSVCADKDGYNVVYLRWDGKNHTRRIARLMAIAFIPNPLSLPEVNHIDENKKNDSIQNLEWVTRKANMTHGTLQERKGEKLRRPVIGISQTTGICERFGSIVEAAQATGAVATHITDVCKGKPHCNTAGGYKWFYEEV